MKAFYQIIIAGVIVAGAALLVAISPSTAGASELPAPVAAQSCPEGSAPGWLDADGISHGCVRDGVPMEPVPCPEGTERQDGECVVPPIECPEGTTPIYTDGNTEGYIEGCEAIVIPAPAEELPVPVEPSAPAVEQPAPTQDTIPAGESSSSSSESSEAVSEESSSTVPSPEVLANTGTQSNVLLQSAVIILILGIIVLLIKLAQKEDHK